MQVASNARKISRVLKAPIFLHSERFLVPDAEEDRHSKTSHQWRNQRSFSLRSHDFSGIRGGDRFLRQHLGHRCLGRACYCSATVTDEGTAADEVPSEDVKEVYDKMFKSVKGETMPPNAWTWSLIEKCANREDIKLLFQMLQDLRRFRCSNLRIIENFNSTLGLRVSEACTRVGALDYGKKTLWEHNVYGLTPSIASAHNLLAYAKEHNNAELMVEIMKLMKKNHMPLQPGTADIVFRICYNTDNWELITKYSKIFIMAGAKLRRTTFDTWMSFAAKRGDVESLWKIEKLRSEMTKQHTAVSAVCCAKGLLLERKPEDAAAIIHILNQKLPDGKRQGIADEIQKLVSEWPMEVIKHQDEADRKALATSLKADIPSMINHLLKLGSKVSVDLNDLTREEAVSC